MSVCLFSLIASLHSSSSPPQHQTHLCEICEKAQVRCAAINPREEPGMLRSPLSLLLFLKDGKLVIVRLHQANRIKVAWSHCGLINTLGAGAVVVVGKSLKSAL